MYSFAPYPFSHNERSNIDHYERMEHYSLFPLLFRSGVLPLSPWRGKVGMGEARQGVVVSVLQ
jgi:hypothetical protein